ncbi:class V aminotransferase (plasmid) [Cylindrospermum sp. NIES-4074]|nr:class V aminotransferase [Cylindrospermum sp. NIES-4074]
MYQNVKSFCKKEMFQLGNVHYLNCAYMSPLSKKVEEAGIIGMQRKRIPTTLKSEDFFHDTEKVRNLFAKIIGAPDPYQIAIIPSVSYGMAVIAKNTDFKYGQNIVIASGQMPSNVHTWQKVCQQYGLELRVVNPEKSINNYVSNWSEKILESIDVNTALVTLGHVHWTDGTLFDLKNISQRAHECGSAFIVDGTQSIGALPLNISDIQPDALICAAYKWLMGPYSIGLAYFGSRYLNGIPLEENWINRLGSENFPDLVNYKSEYRPKAIRYDVGEVSNFILLPMLATALEQLVEWGIENIQNYCRDLSYEFINDIAELGFFVADEKERCSHLIGVRMPNNIELEKLQKLLNENNIAISVRGNSMRVSPNIYNDLNDMNALIKVLRNYPQ